MAWSKKLIFSAFLLIHSSSTALYWQNKVTAALPTVVRRFAELLPGMGTYLKPPLDCPKKYSINLMWINRSALLDQPYIYPIDHENNTFDYLDTLVQWALYNPEGSINLWYDGLLTSEKAVKATQKQINALREKKELTRCDIALKDIRDCEFIQKMPDLFSADMPVYWRADFARAIVVMEEVKNNQDACCIYTDFDIKPLKKEQLFDQDSLHLLKKFGFVMAYEQNLVGFENSFQMFMYDEKLLKAIQDIIITANIIRGRSFQKEIEEKEQPTGFFCNPVVWKRHEVSFQENVFYSYPLMHTYLGQLHGTTKLTLLDKGHEYDLKDSSSFEIDTSLLMVKSSAYEYVSQCPIPTKKVSAPPSTSKERSLQTIVS